MAEHLKNKRKEQLAADEISSEYSPLNEALEEVAEKIDEAVKTCEKLRIMIKKSKIMLK